MQVDMLDAKMKLSQLVEAAERGEEVGSRTPVAQIVPLGKPKFNFGFLEGEMPPIADDLLFAMSEEEADRFIEGLD